MEHTQRPLPGRGAARGATRRTAGQGAARHGAAQPTWGVGDGGVEAAEVDEGVRAEEEVGDDGGDSVELRWQEEEDSELSAAPTETGGRQRAGGRRGSSAYR